MSDSPPDGNQGEVEVAVRLPGGEPNRLEKYNSARGVLVEGASNELRRHVENPNYGNSGRPRRYRDWNYWGNQKRSDAVEIPEDRIPENAADITHDKSGKLWKVVLHEGDSSTSEHPAVGMVAKIHYRSWFLLDDDKNIFDESRLFENDSTPIEFVVGNFEVLRAFDEGVRTMKKGEKSLFIAHFDYAYGRNSSMRTQTMNIPNESFICSEIELADIIDDISVDYAGEIVREVVVRNEDGDIVATDNVVVFVRLVGHYEGQVFYPEVILPFTPVSCLWGCSHDKSNLSKVIAPGLGNAILRMKSGEKAWITLSGSATFEEEFTTNSGVRIPAGDSVKYFVEILEIEELFEPFVLSFEEKVEKCEHLVNQALCYIGQRHYDAAAKKLLTMTGYLHDAKSYLKKVDPDMESRSDKLLFTGYLNLAKLYGKWDVIKMKFAMSMLETALNLTSVDEIELAYYERGLLFMEQKEFTLAIKDLAKSVHLLSLKSDDNIHSGFRKTVSEKLKEARSLEKQQNKCDPLRYYAPK